MTFIRKLIDGATRRDGSLIDHHVELSEEKTQVILSESAPCKAVYVAVDEHYGNRLSIELDNLARQEEKLVGEIAQRERRLSEVRRSQRALNAGLAVLQTDMEASAS